MRVEIELPKWIKLPNWLKEKYLLLWKNTKGKEFTFDEALEILREKDKRKLSVALSRLNKTGWLEVGIHPEDSRRRIYSLKLPKEESIKNLIEETASKIRNP